MPLTEIGKFEQSVGCKDRIGTHYEKMSKPPVGLHGRKGKTGTLGTCFGLFRQFGKRTAEYDQNPILEGLPHQRVMQQGKLLERTVGRVIENTEPAGYFHPGNLLSLPKQPRSSRINQFTVIGRTDFPDNMLKIFQMNPFEQPVPSEMKHDIDSRSDHMQELFFPS